MKKAANMNISVPKSMIKFVENEVRRGGFNSTSDYVQSIIKQRRNEHRQILRNHRHIKKMLLEGLASGPPQPWIPEQSIALKQKLIAKYGKRRMAG